MTTSTTNPTATDQGPDNASDNPWSYAEGIWRECFHPVHAQGFTLQRVTREQYWQVHEPNMRQHSPPEVYFNTPGLRTQHERAGQERMNAIRADNPLRDFCIVRRDGAPIGFFCGHQHERGSYRMYHTHVHPDFRRQGLYTAILRATIDYTGKLGFDSIVSEHEPGNNPVIIAKLKVGFRIMSMDIIPMEGVSVRLCYFHNQEHLAAYRYRCGLATITPGLLTHGSGAMPRLIEQFAAGAHPGDETGDGSAPADAE